MAKLLLEIIAPLKEILPPALYSELLSLCPGDNDQRELPVLANKIREKLALELWKEYSEAHLDAIYEAAQQITHEYPVAMECPISLETITLGDSPETRPYPDADGNPMYAFSAVSGHIYLMSALQRELRRTQADPTTRQPYSPYELRRLGIALTDYSVQTNHEQFQYQDRVDPGDIEWASRLVYGCGVWTAKLRVSVLVPLTPLANVALAAEISGNPDMMILSLMSVYFSAAAAIGTYFVIKHYHTSVTNAPDDQTRGEKINAMQFAGLVGFSAVVLPILLMAYASLGIEVANAIEVFSDQSEDSSSKMIGLSGGIAYAGLLSLLGLSAAWKLKGLPSYTSPVQTDTLRRAQSQLSVSLHLIAFPLILGALGVAAGMGTSREHGTLVGVALGVMMAGISLSRNHLPGVPWLVRRGEDAPPREIELRPVNSFAR